MAADIVPELYEQIRADFEQKMNRSKPIKTFRSRVEKQTADAKGVSLYAAELGKCASYALTHNLTEKNLPDGKLYWNIAERTIKPLLEEVHMLVMQAAAQVQKQEDAKIGIGLTPIKSTFPKERINDLMNKLISVLEEAANECTI